MKPNKYPKKYPIIHRRILVSCIELRPIKIIPNDPVMRYRYNNDNTIHFYMHNRNHQWWWCYYYLDK
jgi:hypothetical protein